MLHSWYYPTSSINTDYNEHNSLLISYHILCLTTMYFIVRKYRDITQLCLIGIAKTKSDRRDRILSPLLSHKKKNSGKPKFFFNSATRIRTWKCWNQNPVPYHLAIALYYVVKTTSVRKRIRTPDLLVRSQTLYPAELCAHKFLKDAGDRNRTDTGV